MGAKPRVADIPRLKRIAKAHLEERIVALKYEFIGRYGETIGKQALEVWLSTLEGECHAVISARARRE